MKKLFSLSIILSILLSCSGDDDGGSDPANTLIGNWNVTKIVYQNTAVGTIEPTVSGTILFRGDGTGRENYTYTISGIPIPNVSNFTWSSTNSQIVFDEGTSDEATWNRLQNTASIQVGRFSESTGNTTITITLEK